MVARAVPMNRVMNARKIAMCIVPAYFWRTILICATAYWRTRHTRPQKWSNCNFPPPFCHSRKRMKRRPSRMATAANWTTYRLISAQSEEHTSELQSPTNIVCSILLEKKKPGNAQQTPQTTKHKAHKHQDANRPH